MRLKYFNITGNPGQFSKYYDDAFESKNDTSGLALKLDNAPKSPNV